MLRCSEAIKIFIFKLNVVDIKIFITILKKSENIEKKIVLLILVETDTELSVSQVQ